MVTDAYPNVEIRVQDHGIGINKAQVDSLFGQNDVISTAGTKQETGTGLGLKITKEFVERHGGDISVQSEEGKGSEFIVRIPKNL